MVRIFSTVLFETTQPAISENSIVPLNFLTSKGSTVGSV